MLREEFLKVLRLIDSVGGDLNTLTWLFIMKTFIQKKYQINNLNKHQEAPSLFMFGNKYTRLI